MDDSRVDEILIRKNDRPGWLANGLLVLALAALVFAYLEWGRVSAIEVLQTGGSGFWQRLVSVEPGQEASVYAPLVDIVFTRLMMGLVVLIGAIAVAGYAGLRWNIAGYFARKESALKLAVLRVVTFGALFFAVDLQVFEIPPEAAESTEWFRFLEGAFGVDNVFWCLAVGLKVICVLGFLGIFARLAAVLASATGLYLTTAPELAQTGFQEPFLLWFTALLATCRCADALSLPAALRHPGSIIERLTGERDSRIYSLPSRIAWLLIGLAFFFPSFWPLWEGGYPAGLALGEELVRGSDLAVVLGQTVGLTQLIFGTVFVFMVVFRGYRGTGVALWLALAAVNWVLTGGFDVSFHAFALVFLAWERFSPLTLEGQEVAATESSSWLWLPASCGAVLIAANLYFGAIREGNASPIYAFPAAHPLSVSGHFQLNPYPGEFAALDSEAKR